MITFNIKTALYSVLILFILFGQWHVNGQKIKKKPSLNGKNIVFIYGGWKGHKPAESVDVFVPKLEAEGARVKTFNSLDAYADKALMDSTDLIIQTWTMGKLTKDQFNGLRRAVLKGTGLAGWHGGLGDSFRDNINYQFMVGGQFLSHPGGQIDHSVTILDKKDPITKGIKSFELKKTEQYYMLVDPNVKVLATTTFNRAFYMKKGKTKDDIHITGSVIPVVWKKNYGKGRIFYSSIGHKMSDFDVPEVLKIQMRGFRWASEGKYMPKEETISPAYK
jgi:hypothetical protein